MSWILLSVLAPVCWAIGNVGDKFIFSKWIKHPVGALMAFGFGGMIAALIVFFLQGFGHAPFNVVIGALLSGVLYMFANLFYYKAVQQGEISRIIPIIYLEPLITAIIPFVILGELFSPFKYFGIALMVTGAIIISYEKNTGFKLSKAVWLALIAAVLFSLNVVFTKYLLNRADFWSVFAYVRVGTFLSLIPFSYFYKDAFNELINLDFQGIGALLLNNAFTMMGILFFTIASSIGFVTLTTSMSATQPFFVLIITLILGFFAPHILKEKQSKHVFFQKLLAIALMFIGVILIS